LKKLSYRAVLTTKTEIYLGSLDEIHLQIKKRHFRSTRKIHLVLDEGLPEEHKINVIRKLEEIGKEIEIFYLPSGEDAKRFETVGNLVKNMIISGLTRNDKVVVVGGGAVLDAGNFAASIALRGIKSVLIPTTLLSMIDASIGGKTGLNVNSIKNQLGTFYQPEVIIIDSQFLKTLPEEEIKSGLGEIIKTLLLLGDSRTLLRFEKNPLDEEVIFKCIRYKSSIVKMDPYETKKRREWLNFGHTIGHALEASNVGKIKHGIAVACGLFYEQLMAEIYFEEQGLSIKKVSPLIKRLLSASGISLLKTNPNEIIPLFKYDKKVRESSEVRFVYLKDVGKPSILKVSENDFQWLFERAIEEV
jgi:3-dehydroquinate synthase